MFNPVGLVSTFGRQLLRAQSEANTRIDPAITADLQHWLEYWNDAESVGANLRKFEHWLQRARAQDS